jgi:hypothetical protein
MSRSHSISMKLEPTGMAAGVQPNGSVQLPSVTLGNEASARQNWDMTGTLYGQLEDTAKPGCGPFPPQLYTGY